MKEKKQWPGKKKIDHQALNFPVSAKNKKEGWKPAKKYAGNMSIRFVRCIMQVN